MVYGQLGAGVAGTQAPLASHAFTIMVSAQLGSPGGQSLHAAPHASPAHGS
jgi:hypothetical protein